MSGAKFAAMTAGLLARKGDAQPSAFVPPTPPPPETGWVRFAPPHFEKNDIALSVPPLEMRAAERGAHVLPDVRVREAKEAAVAADGKPRRLFVNLAPEEYERLGIVAVKRDSTRHHLLRDALDAFLKKTAREYRDACACVSGACKGACER